MPHRFGITLFSLPQGPRPDADYDVGAAYHKTQVLQNKSTRGAGVDLEIPGRQEAPLDWATGRRAWVGGAGARPWALGVNGTLAGITDYKASLSPSLENPNPNPQPPTLSPA